MSILGPYLHTYIKAPKKIVISRMGAQRHLLDAFTMTCSAYSGLLSFQCSNQEWMAGCVTYLSKPV